MICPICNGTTFPAGEVDANKTCEDHKGARPFPVARDMVKYERCIICNFMFAPAMCSWTPQAFKERIYNAEYIKADPDYKGVRAKANAAMMIEWFGRAREQIRHIDYGAGDGQLTRCLRCEGFKSTAWEPLDETLALDGDDRFNLVTAFEVFEHCPDPRKLRDDLIRLLSPDGVIVFSTLTSDACGPRFHPADWWYAAPRNGHVALYTKIALRNLLYPLRVYHVNEGIHFAFSTCPKWLEVSLQ